MPNTQARPKTVDTNQIADNAVTSESMDQSTEPQDHPMASFLDPFIKQTEFQWWGARNVNAMAEMTSASIHGAMSIANEATRFMSQRLHEDMETAKTFSGCKNGEDLFRCGSDFFDSTIRSYADETAKMIHLTADATQAVCKPIEDRTKEALHSVAAIPTYNGMFV